MIYCSLDKITFSNIRIVNIKDIEYLEQKDILHHTVKSSIKSKYVTDTQQIFNNIKIEQSGLIDLMVCGCKYGAEYCNITTSIKNPQTSNLYGHETIADLRQRLQDIQEYLYSEYGIEIDISETKISYIEIQKTFKLDGNFAQYQRALYIISQSHPYPYTTHKYYSKNNYICAYYSFNKHNPLDENIKKDTHKKFKSLVIYDKGQQLKQKMSINHDLLRVEMRIKGKDYIVNELGTNNLEQITDDLVDEYWIKVCNRLFYQAIEDYRKQEKKLIQSLFAEYKDSKHFCLNVLTSALNISAKLLSDKKGQKIVVIDINSILQEVSHMKINKHTKQNYKKAFEKFMLENEKRFDSLLSEDNKKIDEILEKLVAEKEKLD